MRRYALLVEASKAKGQGEIAGCRRDVERLNVWLSSLAGGAWNSNEIRVLNNPTMSEIKDARTELNLSDYAFVTFSGHGRILEDSTGRRTQRIIIGTGDEIDFEELKPTASKSVLLCDACREIHRDAESPLFTKAAQLDQYELRAAEAYTRQRYRQAFESSVGAAAPGCYKMYSCSPGQCAGDDPLNGGVFTDALLNRAGEWFERSREFGILTIDVAFEAALRSVSRTYPDQIPVGGPSSRSGNPFPFSVRLK